MDKKVNISKNFIGFLIASFLIWALINLSKEYTSKISYAVKYQNLAQDKLLKEDLPKEISILIKGTGFKLLSSKISTKTVFLKTDKLVSKKKDLFYFLPAEQKLSILEQLPKGLQIAQFLKDTIYLKIGSLISKKVPITTKTNLQFSAGYNLVNQIKIIPDSITISGVLEQINKIKSIATEELELENISGDFSKELTLKNLKFDKNIRFSHKNITVKGIVDKFTEGKFEVPIIVENVPFGAELNIFPKKVTVTYKIGLKDFGKISSDSFKIVCDFKDVQENKLTYLLPKVKSKPALVSSIKISPEKIEYLIHK